jgi:hypothetical protein
MSLSHLRSRSPQAPGGGGGADNSDSDVDYEAVNPAARAVAARAQRGGPPPAGFPNNPGDLPPLYPPLGGMPSRALPPRAARTAAAASGWPSLGWLEGPTVDTPRAGQENLHPLGGGGGAGATAAAAAAAAAPCAPGVPELTAAHVNAAADAAAAVMQTVLAQQGARGDATLLPPSELAKLVASAMLTETMRLGFMGNAAPQAPQQQQQQQQQQQRRKTKATVPVFGTSQHAALPTPEAAAQFAVRAVQDLAGLGGLSGMPFPGAGGAMSGGGLSAPPVPQVLGASGAAAHRAGRGASAPHGAAARAPAAVFTAHFTALQLRCVRKQLHEHTQLLLQVLTLSARAPGPAMAAAASTTYGLLAGLVAARGAALETGAGERYPVSLLTTSSPEGALYCGPGGASWISVADESLIQGDDGVYGSDVEAWWPGAPTTGVATLLDIPPLRHIPEFLAAVDTLPAAPGGQHGAGAAAGWSGEPNMMGGGADDDDTEADPDAMPKARRHRAQPPSAAALPLAHPVLRDLLALRFGHSRVSSPALVVQPSTWPRDQFTPGEDRLLATGFHTFGRNWAAVAQHLLPSRSTLQLSNRWKNATGAARNAKAVKGRSGAPLRAAAAAVTAPLTVNEAQALRAARTAVLGQKSALTVSGTPLVWSQLAAHCWRLSHVQRPASVLQKLWRELLAASGCINKAKGKGGASAPEDEAEPEPEEPAAHHEAAMMGPMDGDDAWRDADVDPEAQPLGGPQQPGDADAGDEPRGGDAPAGAASLLYFPSGDAPGCAVTARELRGSPAAPMDRYELMDAFMLQHQLCQAAPAGPSIPAQAPQPPQVPVAVQAAPSGGRSGGWRELPPPPPPVAPAGVHTRLPEPLGLVGEMPCHSNGGITALLADVGIHLAVTGAPSWAPPPMQPGRGRHGTASARKRDAGDDTQTVATGAGGGATSSRRRRVLPAPSATAQPPAVAKKSQGGSGSGQAARKKSHGGEEALATSTGKRKRASKPAVSSAGGTNSGQHKSVPRPRPGARSGAAAPELPHFDDADFVFDPADIPPEELIHDDVALKKRRLQATGGGGARPTMEHTAAVTLSAMCAPLPRGNSPPSTGKRPREREYLPDSPVQKRVTFAEQETLMDSDGDEPGPPPPEPLPLSPRPPQPVPAQQQQLPPQPVPVPSPAAEVPRAVEAAPVAAALRDNEVLHEGEVLQFSPAEDRAILLAARGAPQGKPTLMTFAMLLCDADHPLLVGGKSAAQAQTRYLDLVRRMTAARAKLKAAV